MVMREKGQARVITDKPMAKSSDRRDISRSDYLKEVQALMEKSRGRELPGSFSPLIVAELFSRQSEPQPSRSGGA